MLNTSAMPPQTSDALTRALRVMRLERTGFVSAGFILTGTFYARPNLLPLYIYMIGPPRTLVTSCLVDLAAGSLLMGDGLDLAVDAMIFGNPAVRILRMHTNQGLPGDRDQFDETVIHPALQRRARSEP